MDRKFAVFLLCVALTGIVISQVSADDDDPIIMWLGDLRNKGNTAAPATNEANNNNVAPPANNAAPAAANNGRRMQITVRRRVVYYHRHSGK